MKTDTTNLALFCALTGAKTLLIDADLRRCDLSTKLAPGALTGIPAVVRGDVGIAETLKQLSVHLWFLPAGKACGTANSSELVRSNGMKRLLATGADLFHYIIIDLPPLLSMVDGRAIEPLVTQFLYIVGWGTVSRHVVRDALFQNTAVYKKCLGVILNRVDQKLISRYVAGDAHGLPIQHVLLNDGACCLPGVVATLDIPCGLAFATVRRAHRVNRRRLSSI